MTKITADLSSLSLRLRLAVPAAALALALAGLGGCSPCECDDGASLVPPAHADEPAVAPAIPAAPAPAASPLGEAAPKEGTLEHFMKTQVKAAMSSGDIAKVKEALKKLPAWVPDPTWNEGPTGWKAIVEAATKPDGNVGKACKGCHEVWQKAYKEKFHDRVLPK